MSEHKWIRSYVGRSSMGLLLAVMIGSIGVEPAISKDNHNGKGKHDSGHYEKKGHGHDRAQHEHSGSVHQTTVYHDRFYVPQPIVLVPPPPPGISIFFPPIIIHP